MTDGETDETDSGVSVIWSRFTLWVRYKSLVFTRTHANDTVKEVSIV